jgi:hypothetical protein
MQRLIAFLTSWPVVVLVSIGLVILLVWPDDTERWIRTLRIMAFLFAYIGI